jgi:(1->4)-alpha-D-glucan 1-alpha-D-glucosylmutase
MPPRQSNKKASPPDALDELAALCGIEGEFVDFEGKSHSTSRETKRALLAAMGVVADTKAQAEAALRAERDRPWLALVPEVTVVRTPSSGVALFHLYDSPQPPAGRAWARIRSERGDQVALSLGDARRVAEHDGALGRIIQFEVPLPPLPHGIYQIEAVECGDRPRTASGTLLVAPPRCYVPPAVAAGGRVFGFSVQLYTLREPRGWGLGTYAGAGDLAQFLARRCGADALALSPVHLTPNADPHDVSPYCPLSRIYKNPVYLDLENEECVRRSPRALELLQNEATRARIGQLDRSPEVPYARAAALKMEVLRAAFADFAERDLCNRTAAGREFEQFRERGGEDLARFGLFMALRDAQLAAGPSGGYWRHWPRALRAPDGAAVRAFQSAHPWECNFHIFVQWLCEKQLLQSHRSAVAAGMKIGLYHDLAVGSSAGSVEAWTDPEAFAHGVEIGAPPDAFQKNGQRWGVVPMNPRALRAGADSPFVRMIRAAMRSAGALRIDHVMGLFRLWWVPSGMDATRGAYVKYPFDELLAILAIESERHGTMVVGEDLGTVAPGVRERMERERIFGCQLALFERTAEGGFTPPEYYRAHTVASFGTHDLPTLAAWWLGEDLKLRSRLGLFRSEKEKRESRGLRDRERAQWLAEFTRAGLDPSGLDGLDVNDPRALKLFIYLFHSWLAGAGSAIVLASLDDALAETAQRNVPGTLSEYPNWRARLPLTTEELYHSEELAALGVKLQRRQPRLT